MKIPFHKYQATGNDFVIIDNRELNIALSKAQIQSICDRRFGVGADGVMLIQHHPSTDFNLLYFNADGSASLCGNGSRAAVTMAAALGLIASETHFQAYDGVHEASVLPNGWVRLKMADVNEVKKNQDDYFINTGSPHVIRFVKNVESFPVVEVGREIRYSTPYQPAGTNANFVELLENNTLFIRTYERGVEDETLSCGTGVTASALAASKLGYHSPVQIKTRGGDLQVEFKIRHDGLFEDIFLIGPAKMVFEGVVEL